MKKGLVSIIIPCYNGEKYIDTCFQALLKQTYKKLEIIVINDGSTDKSFDIINSYKNTFKNKDIIYKILNQNNQGQAVAVNNGLKEVTGEFLMWQDIDDVYENDAVENLLNYLSENRECNVVRGEVEYKDSKLERNLGYGKSKSPDDYNLFDKYIFEKDSYCYPGIFMVRMQHFDKCIKKREIYTSRAGQNWQLILPITYLEKSGYLNKKVYNYRVVENSHSHNVKKFKDLLRRCDEHQDILLTVIAGIEMPIKTRKKYIKKIKIKYIKKKIRIILSKIKRLLMMRDDNLKNIVKKIPGVKYILNQRRKFKGRKEFQYDKDFFFSNYVKSKNKSINKISYDLIRITHSLEKGLSNNNPRPFGKNVINELIKLIKEYESISSDYNFAYNLTLTGLNNYVNFYESKKWTEEKTYQMVKEFLKFRTLDSKKEAGSIKYKKEELEQGMNFDYRSFLETRHSVRNFSNKKVKNKDLEAAINMAIMSPSACNRQMIKVYNYINKEDIKYISKVAQGVGGFVLDNINYLVITFDVNSFYFVGERNQGWFNAGLFSMNLVNALHSNGIGSCFIQFGNTVKEEEQIKKRLRIPSNERIAIFIAYGYYDNESLVPISSRKNIKDIYINNL